MGVGYNPRIVTDGLVLCLDAANKRSYPGSGTTWIDKVGGNDGTLTNGPTFSSDNGGILVFDGTNDYTNFGNILNDVFAGADKKFSIMSWVNYNTLDLNGGNIINKVGDSNFSEDQRQISLKVRNPNNNYGSYELEFFTYFNLFVYNYRGYRTVGADIQTGRFYHFCVSYDGNIDGSDRYGLFVDGVKYSVTPTYTQGSWGNIQSGTARLAIGAQIGASSSSPIGLSDASIGNLSIYNRALSAKEVLQNYEATKGRYA